MPVSQLWAPKDATSVGRVTYSRSNGCCPQERATDGQQPGSAEYGENFCKRSKELLVRLLAATAAAAPPAPVIFPGSDGLEGMRSIFKHPDTGSGLFEGIGLTSTGTGLAKRGFTHAVACSRGSLPAPECPGGLRTVANVWPGVSTPGSNAIAVFVGFFTHLLCFVETALARGHNIVLCGDPQSVAASVVACVMHMYELPLSEAITFSRLCSPRLVTPVEIQPGFFEVLKSLEDARIGGRLSGAGASIN